MPDNPHDDCPRCDAFREELARIRGQLVKTTEEVNKMMVQMMMSIQDGHKAEREGLLAIAQSCIQLGQAAVVSKE